MLKYSKNGLFKVYLQTIRVFCGFHTDALTSYILCYQVLLSKGLLENETINFQMPDIYSNDLILEGILKSFQLVHLDLCAPQYIDRWGRLILSFVISLKILSLDPKFFSFFVCLTLNSTIFDL